MIPTTNDKTEPMLNEGQIEAGSLLDKQNQDRQTVEYWKKWVRKSRKMQPVKVWKEADEALKVPENENERPYVSGYRLLYESLKSFLDQTDASFRVIPTDAFMGDDISQKQAEADYAYLNYIWREKKCQIAESKKLDSALRKNVGFTVVSFDKKKWMPYVHYIRAENVLLDPYCDGIAENATAQGYFENISLEDLIAKNTDLTEDELASIKKSAGYLIDEDDMVKLDKENPEDKVLYTTVALYHIFVKNSAAVRKIKDGEPDNPDMSAVEKLNLDTPRKYIQIVEGLDRPLREIDGWPFDLDDDEWYVSKLSFNTMSEDWFAYTDCQQMARADTLCDNIFSDIEDSAFYAGKKKFGGRPDAAGLTEVDIQNFINDPKRSYLSKILDSNGEQLVKEIVVGKFEPALIQAYTIADESRMKSSALGELLTQEVEQYKDVTAIATRLNDANTHQRVNRRLSGPEGYEVSIGEDAIKLLEVAHQLVPQVSKVEIVNELRQKVTVDMEWPQAVAAMQTGAKVVMLGADAIIGRELAQYWRTSDKFPPKVFKLSTSIQVLPGSTRSITKEQKAAMMKQLFMEVYGPYLTSIGRLDLVNEFLSRIGHLASIEGIDELLPETTEVKGVMDKQEQVQTQTANMADEQQQLKILSEAAKANVSADEQIPKPEKPKEGKTNE